MYQYTEEELKALEELANITKQKEDVILRDGGELVDEEMARFIEEVHDFMRQEIDDMKD